MPESSTATNAATDTNAAIERAFWRLHTHRGQPDVDVAEVLAQDLGNLAAHHLRAAMIVAADRFAARAELATSLAVLDAAALEAADPMRRHAAAARAWLEGDAILATARYTAILADDPLDLLALVVAHALDFRFGRRELLHQRVARVRPAWSEARPGCASVLAMQAFGLVEDGRQREAEQLARRALELDPDHPGAVHVVVHVMEMQGRAREGGVFLARHAAALREPNGFARHLDWHRALFHFELGDIDAALQVHDTRLADAPAGWLAPLADASALLWRLELHGIDVRQRWAALADRWECQALVAAGPFFAVHAMMAFAVAGRADAGEGIFDVLRGDASRVCASDPPLAEPLCRALLAFAEGRYVSCVERLDAVRTIAHRCGGSLAQCDVIHLTHTEAALRARRTVLARALVAERSARKPASRINQLLQARALSLAALPA